MKKFRNIFLLSLAAAFILAFTGCQNNGNIGRLFGTWRLDAYMVNGQSVDTIIVERDTVSVNNVTFSFQSEVVNVSILLDKYLSAWSTFGTWSEEGDSFTFNFTHSDPYNALGTGSYSAPVFIGMESNSIMTMKVTDSKRDSFTLNWTDSEGNSKIYKLHKTW